MSAGRTIDGFSRTAKLLHWLVAAVFLIEYCVIYAKHWFVEEDSAAAMSLLQVHQTVGLSLIVFVAWRICWRIGSTRPPTIDRSHWARLGAAAVHFSLYFFMVAMPITGYVYASNATVGFGVFALPPFEDTAVAQWLTANWDLTFKEGIRAPAREFHREIAGELLLWMLIALHVSAALYHHFVLRDDVLLRMLPNRFGGKPEN